jgi:receptor protein-tyrosine kinase
MTTSPKASLVERLVQDRLRSGGLEASAARMLLQLGGGLPEEATSAAAPARPAGPTNGEASANPPASPAPVVALRGTPPVAIAAPLVHISLDPFSVAPASLDPAPRDPAPLGPPSLGPPSLDPASLGLSSLDRIVPGETPAPAAQTAGAQPPVPGFTHMPGPQPDGTVAAETNPPLAAPTVLSQAETPGEVESDPAEGSPMIDAVALERGGMVDWSRTRTRISEEFRLVQRQILRAAFGPDAEPGFSNLLLVTSARPGEGKSFTAVNLAGSIARQGDNHVLLVDADSKRDSFCYALGLAENRGLLDLVANPKLDPSPLIVKTPIELLSILPVGRERERSAELFSTKEMTRLIQSLGRRYADRLLILDAPPCLSTSDPAVLAPVVGQILFVVEAERTQRDEVEASLDLIQACPNITLVLNKQQISSRYTFGAYSSYYSS